MVNRRAGDVNCPFWKSFKYEKYATICEGYYHLQTVVVESEEAFIIHSNMRCRGDFTKCPYWQLTMRKYGGKDAYPYKSGISEYNVGAEIDMNRYKGERK